MQRCSAILFHVDEALVLAQLVGAWTSQVTRHLVGVARGGEVGRDEG